MGFKFVDANILLRYILNDNEEQAEKAEKIIEAGEAYVLPEVLAEVVYVLTKVYEKDRKDVAAYLLRLLKLLVVENQNLISKTLSIFAETRLDFVDCILCAHSILYKKEIMTFDKKLQNFIKSSI